MLAAGRVRFFTVVSCLLIAPELCAGPPVAPTEPLTPQQERTKFKLRPGFEIQLVAAEPDIQKPMNLNFDARGRLWVTHSIEYPFAAADPEQARDGLTILDGIGADGRATTVTRFADKLNIPIGVLPLPNGHEAIVWSIPNIWKLTDSDGDGTADKREVLYGPFDFVDTHGDQNAFRLGNDGWIYACHGFRNSSRIKLRGTGPVVLEMQSGNTYRFKSDGSAIEQISWGQVNPFGSCIDARGDMFTADCHSKPITMILRGGYYDSFGKRDNGLGYAPITTSNDHGSTGIAGVVAYAGNQFPADYTGSMFVGNVVTNIIHRDTIDWRGSSPWVEKVEDFVMCDDWWFHPVDLQLGPDGALYVSDFYNSIIGHYEVDLKHPRRDRLRGRIWRIVYTGMDQKTPVPAVPNLQALPIDALVERLSDRNTAVRNLAGQDLQERFSDAAPARAKMLLEQAVASTESAQQAGGRVQALWLLFRLGQLDETTIHRLAGDPEALVRIHLVRAMGETNTWTPAITELVRAKLADSDPFVQRAAVEAIGRHPDSANVQSLVRLWNKTPSADVQLIHATRIAIREHLLPTAAVDQIAKVKLERDELAKVVEIALAVPTESAAWFTFDYIRQHEVSQTLVELGLQHVARQVGNQRLDAVAAFVQHRFPQDTQRQAVLFQSLFEGLTQRGAKLSPDSPLGEWATKLATTLLDPLLKPSTPWTNHAVPGLINPASGSPWGVTRRNSTDGNADARYFDSIANGEQLTGVLTSVPFVIPSKLTYWMCGHNGAPGTSPTPVNHVRLRLVESGEVVAKELPPRNDVARQYTWDLQKWAGQQGVFEAIDASTAAGYAWLAIGRFEPEVVTNPAAGFTFSDRPLVTAIQVAGQLRLEQLAMPVVELLKSSHADTPVRMAAAQVGVSLNRTAAVAALMTIVQNPNEPAVLRTVAAQQLGPINTQPSLLALATALGTAPGPLQQPIALAMTSTKPGSEMLFSMISQGRASARLLQDKPLLDRLSTFPIAHREQRIKDLTQGIPAADERLKQFTQKLAAGLNVSQPAPEAGAAVFKKACAACHRINNEGGKVGPQLDGVGNRGLERLIEDVLDPNRNVDAAFRATIIAKTDGIVVTGLKLREEGQALILGDSSGKEVRISLDEIEESRLSNLSPMPSNIGEQLNEADLHALLTFLLNQRLSPVAGK